MSGSRRRWVALAAALVCTVGVAVTWPTSAAQGSPLTFETGDFPGDLGVLRLHLGAQDYFRFDAADGSGGYTAGTAQGLAVSGCNLPTPTVLNTAGVQLTPTPNGGVDRGALGLVNDGIGVQVKGEGNGTSCGQVNGTGQKVTLQLAGAIADKTMDYAEIDIEGKFTVTIKAELFRGTTAVGTPRTLSFTGSDSGPDSSARDNRRWRIDASDGGLFNTIVLSVDASTPGGAFSLEGGADGTPAYAGGLAATKLGGSLDSVFHVTAASFLACGGTTTEGNGVDVPQADITLQNTDGCSGIPYNLETGTDSDGHQAILFQKDAETTSRFFATFTWQVEEANYPVPPTQIDFGDGNGPNPLTLCDGTYAAPELPLDGDGNVIPWCLRRHTATTAGDGLMQVVEQVYGIGDPFSFR